MKVLMYLIGVLLGLCVLGLIAAGVGIYQHQKFLEENGCQETFRQQTGKRLYCGKACSRAEEIVIYECADGRRIELQ